MGYTIYVRAKDAAQRDRIYEVLERTLGLETLKKMFKLDSLGGRLAKGKGTGGLSYCNHTNGVGFDYSSWVSTEESAYLYSVMRWVARALGQSSFYYDGDEEKFQTVLPSQDMNEFLIKRLGKRNHKKLLLFISNELENISQAWG